MTATFLIRTRNAGVWVCAQHHDSTLPWQVPGQVWVAGARRLWRWRNSSHELTDIAQRGILEGDVGPVSDPFALNWADICEVHEMREAAVEAFERLPEWRHERA